MKQETLLSISERAGVSITTVSRVLNGKAEKYRISRKTVELVRREAEKCNYKPNIAAQSLRTKRTQTIGLVVPSIENPFFANIASIIIQKAKQAGYTVVLTDAMENEANEQDGVNSLLARNVDGIIISPSGNDPSYLEQINDLKLPVVLIDRFFYNTTLPYVVTDNYRGAVDAVQCLIDNGHSKIACIQGVPHSTPAKERCRGYRDAMTRAGFTSEIDAVGNDFSIQNGYVETRLLLTRHSPPTAIFAMSNTILLGAIKAVSESGLKIPEDISIISFDDNTYLDFLSPPITRIVQPLDEIGTIAIKILLQSIGDGNRSDAKIVLPASLKVRNSIKPVNRSPMNGYGR